MVLVALAALIWTASDNVFAAHPPEKPEAIRNKNSQLLLSSPLPPESKKTTPDPLRTARFDPDLITGVLPNGMHYYIKRNPFPAKRAMIWLAVDAGSIQEDDDQLGFAHFLEHMAFNGTTNFPGNELIDIVEGAGMSFGADLNAYTSMDETVYQLSMPTDDQESLNNGLQIIQDWAGGNILMDSAEVVAERGVILGEWRFRILDSASHRLQKEMMGRQLGDSSRYLSRFPIGKAELLRHANPGPLMRFYRDWYRPDLMAVIVVGDFDPVEMEKEVKKRFGTIPAADNPRPFARPEVTRSSTTQVQIVKDKVRPEIHVQWPAPPFPTTPEELVKQQLVSQILFPHIQNILNKHAQRERRSFAAASLSLSRGITRPQGISVRLAVQASPDSLEMAIATAISEVSRVAQHGIAASDLQDRKNIILRRLEMAADAQQAEPSRTIAERYVAHYLSGTADLFNPQERLKHARDILPTITSKDIAEAAAFWTQEEGRVVTVHLPMFASVRPSTEESIKGLLDSVSQVTQAETAEVLKEFAVTPGSAAAGNLPNPSINANIVSEEILNQKELIKRWVLSNGATVVFKPGSSNPDEVVIHAMSPGGHSLLPDSLFFSPARLVADLITSAGAVDKDDRDSFLQSIMTGGVRRNQLSLNAFEEEMVISGSPHDLESLFSLMHGQFTTPNVDSVTLESWKRTGFGSLTMSRNDRSALGTVRHRRLGGPAASNVHFMNLEQAMGVFQDRFGDASDFTFYIVGAVSESDIRDLVIRHLGTLPSTNRTEREKPRKFDFTETKTSMIHTDSSSRLDGEQAQGSIMFGGDFTDDPDAYITERAQLTVVSTILGRRLRNRLREEMGVTYSASAPAGIFRIPDNRYQLTTSFVTAPSDLKGALKAAWEEIDLIRTEPVTSYELAIAKQISRRRLENAQQNNNWWISEMQSHDRLNIPYAKIGMDPVAELTAEQVLEAAKKYLPKDRFIQQAAYPTGKKIEEAQKRAEKEREEIRKE